MNETKCTVDYEVHDDIGYIYLNRPKSLNAVIPQLVEELMQALAKAEHDHIKAVILAGRGRAFCAGYDLKANNDAVSEQESRYRIQNIQNITRKIRQAPFPVIASVHGYALGAGCEFALCCDLIIAAEDAQFGFPEVEVGLSVTGGISHLLPMTVGLIKAKELLFLGEKFTAAEAKNLGLINFTAAPEKLQEETWKLAKRLSNLPKSSLVRAKFALNSGSQFSLESAFDLELEHALSTTKLQATQKSNRAN